MQLFPKVFFCIPFTPSYNNNQSSNVQSILFETFNIGLK